MQRRHPDKRQREHDRLEQACAIYRAKAPYMKRLLKRRGVMLPFYEFYDSYTDEYSRTIAEARQHFSSLIDVVEVTDEVYYSKDGAVHPPGMEHIVWTSPGEADGYGVSRDDDDSNMNGFANAYRDADGQLRTLIVLRQFIPNCKPHREFKSFLKLATLLHEIGHVHDMERAINFDAATKRVHMVEAEVFANLYALEQMAKMNYRACFEMVVDAIRKSLTFDDYRAGVAKVTLERLPKYKLVDVLNVPLAPLTADDLMAIGPEGRRALGLKDC